LSPVDTRHHHLEETVTTPEPLAPQREQEIRTLDLTPLMNDRTAAIISGHLAALLDEINRLRAELARRVQCNDCGAVGEVFTADDGRAYLDPSGQIWHEPAARPVL
jgi:hypothetical protein